MDELNKKQNEAVSERADAFMKAATIALVDKNLSEYNKLQQDAKELPISEEFQEKKRIIIERLEKADRIKARKKRMKAFGTVAAVILVGVIAVGTVLTVSVDAFRFRLFDFLKIDHGEYLELVPIESDYISEENHELFPASWQGSFYPAILPEGYALEEAFEAGLIKYLSFVDEEGNYLNLSISPAGETQVGVNNEDVLMSEVKINGAKGYAWERDNTCLIIWIGYEYQFKLFSESLRLDEMLKIAENIRYLKIK